MTPRGTDWSLALLVALGALTGLGTVFAGSAGRAWVFAAHGIGGAALAVVLTWKARRVRRRVLRPRGWDRRTALGLAAAVLSLGALGSGWAWSSGGDVALAGFRLLFWHELLGGALAAVVALHLIARARRLRPRRDLTGRRALLHAAGAAGLAAVAWRLQRPASAALGLPGGERRFTGSYERASFEGNAFPTSSWVADAPRPLDPARYRLSAPGGRSLPLAALDAGDELTATLDCTGGFHSTQDWRGIRLERLLGSRAGSHVRVVSHTGYRWGFSRADARHLLLATHVGGEPLSHGHGAPVRLVAPGRRGFEWVKWVVAIELHDGPDPGAALSTLTSSFTPEGRGTA